MNSILLSRKQFIEDGLGLILSVKKDFADIRYAKTSVTGREIIRVNDIFGRVAFLDVTGDDLEKIADDVFRLALMGKEKVSVPSGYITDTEKMRKAAMLFV